MLKVEIDGKEVEVPHGATVMDATNKLGIYVPHFCYHKKLSIAANCRMCLVEVEKAPKPLPACATPVTDGMKVKTASGLAKKAQNSVMEFLLINHPLDCPICDQGGECQLQDLAVGYGGSASRFQEDKRVVLTKDIGPLVAAEEMSRCIQCTRCVRFGQEVAGVMELGMIGRGEHSEIVAFVGQSVDSELSGNMIDICPVGALTSKPFRYSARTWELARRKSVSPHDGLGSNLVVQVKQNKVMRVLPLENEAINECWLSDKDRFSYEALDSDERLTAPMVKKDGRWEEADWQTALEFAVQGLKDFGVLASPHSTLEELFLAGKLGAGPGNAADFRLRHSDFSGDGKRKGIPWLGMPITDIAKLDRVLVVGSFLRKDHPLLAQRLRQAAKRGTQIHVLHSVDDDWLMKIASRKIVSPSDILGSIASFNEMLKGGKNAAILLGNFVQQHPQAAAIHAAAQAIGVKVGFLGEAANSVGGYVAGLPANGGFPVVQGKKSLLFLNVDAGLDCAPVEGKQFIVNLSVFKSGVGDVLLPIAPFTETPGTFISTEGRAQGFHAAVRPLGDARPAWKVLRVLGTMLGRPGFEYETVEQVREACLAGRDVSSLLSNEISEVKAESNPVQGIQRIADIPIYFADPLARRSVPLQKTRDARTPLAAMNRKLFAQLNLASGEKVRITQGKGAATLYAAVDDKLPDNCVRIAAGHPATAGLGAMFGTVTLERLASEKAA
jgi:NADH-quinone oxidoreductase subunit G